MAPIPYEQKRMFAAYVPTMEVGTNIVNEIGCAHLLTHITPVAGQGYWFVFVGDSWLKSRWQEKIGSPSLVVGELSK